ncbi:MAG: putative lipid II flippase FtsW [Treponemataceae bacterium]|nr:putative lipid II flippase FtsW [Treponemataceae bacterium]
MSTGIFAERPVIQKKSDIGLIVSIILLIGLGLITLYISSASYASRSQDSEFYFLYRQLQYVGGGLVLLIAASCISMNFIRKFLPLFVVVGFVLCFLPFIPGLGVEKNGARRWIAIPFIGTFQPSELAKIAVILFLANLFDKKSDRLDNPAVSVYPAAFGLFAFVIVVFLQDDFSTAFFILMIGFIIFFVAGVYLRWFVAFCIFAVPIALLFVFSEEYRVNRLIAFLRPDYDIHGMNFQLAASRRAITAGGFWGSGFGTGLRYVRNIPEAQADFVFAGWCESMGFFGVLLYFCILLYFGSRILYIVKHARNRFEALVAVGCGSTILLQSLINCGVVCGALPSTGINLPFFSSGGSSVLVMMIACGLLINISRKEFEIVSENLYE